MRLTIFAIILMGHIGYGQQLFGPITSSTVPHQFKYTPTMLAKKAGVFKFTMKTTPNAKGMSNVLSDGGDGIVSNGFRYDIRTKVYVTRRLSILMRTQINGSSRVASIGLVWKIKKR